MVVKKADLYEWIKPLDAIDAALNHLLDANPSLLLIGRQKEPKSALVGSGGSSSASTRQQQAESAADVASVPAPAVEAACFALPLTKTSATCSNTSAVIALTC